MDGMAKPGPSLLKSMALDLVIIQAVALAAIFFLLVQRLEATVTELESRDMREVAQDLVPRLSMTERPGLSLSPAEMARFSPSYGRYAFAVLDRDGQPLLSSLTPLRPLAAVGGSAETGQFRTRLDGALFWGVEIRAFVDGRPVIVQVAEDMNHRDVLMDEIVSGFISRAAWLLAPLFLAQLGFALYRMRRRFLPVISASRSAGDIHPHMPGARISNTGVPEEILPLVDAANSALGRIEAAFRTQREFLGDAAHELKTALAILRARVETLERDPIRGELDADLAALSRMVTQLLRAAEVEWTGESEHRSIVLVDLASDVADYLQPMAAKSGKRLVVSGDESVAVTGSREAIGQAVNNLVENAIQHTLPGTDVEITVSGAPAMELRVIDHGPGIPPEQRELVFQRFWRKGQNQGRGAGLGLFIVRRAMELHGGGVTIGDTPGGGATISLIFSGSDEAAVGMPQS